MNIIGEYSIQYNIYTMFNVYNVKINNHNLITNEGYDFFIKKWYLEEENYPIEFGYYSNNKFYKDIKSNDDYYNEFAYNKTTIYMDKNTNKQYMWNGEELVNSTEKLYKICIGNTDYSNDNTTKPSKEDTELYQPKENGEYKIENFSPDNTSVIIKQTFTDEDLENTTEIGIKTNRGRLVSHDIHAPYRLPVGTSITLEYIFKIE